MALVNPHPGAQGGRADEPDGGRLDGRRLVPQRRLPPQNMSYIYEQEATRDNSAKWWTSTFDDYDMFMRGGSAGELGRIRGLEQVGFWRKLLAHPSYDAFWRDQAMDKILAGQPLKVPTMLVHSLWDAEDIYGAIAVYKALEPKDTGNDMLYLVLGPWHHGGEIEDGSTLGALRFESNTSLYFQRQILRPFLDHYLKDDAPKSDVAPVSGLRDRHRHLAPAGRLARRVHHRLHAQADAARSARRIEARLHRAQERRRAVRRIHLRSRQARALPRPAHPARRLRQRAHLARLAGRRPARGVWPAGRAGVHLGRADGASQDQRAAGGQPDRLDQRDGCRLGRQADRRLPRRGGFAARGWAAIS